MLSRVVRWFAVVLVGFVVGGVVDARGISLKDECVARNILVACWTSVVAVVALVWRKFNCQLVEGR